jgi:large subunit ribosomal protein L25
MSTTTLAATVREGRGKGPARQSRLAGGVPAVVYGLGGDTLSITVDAHDLDKILHTGVNSLISLSIDGTEELALCRQVHRHPVRPVIMHVDFIRVRADVAVEAEVALNLTGEAEGVRNGGLLDQLHFTITISANPGSIPTSIDHDISEMALGDQLHAGDLTVPAGVTVTLDPGELLAQISVPRGLSAAEEAEEAEAAAAAGVEAAPEAETPEE